MVDVFKSGGSGYGRNKLWAQQTGLTRDRRGGEPSLGSSGSQETPQNIHPGEGALTKGEGTLRMTLAMTMNQTMVRFSIGFGQSRHDVVLEHFKN